LKTDLGRFVLGLRARTHEEFLSHLCSMDCAIK
jgi:hypothetical protein